MAKVKTILAVLAVGLAIYYYNCDCNKSSQKINKPVSPIVKTLSGSLQGVISLSREGREFYEYLGIPYAKPPVGSLRYEVPQPVDKWNGVRNASAYGSICLQIDGLSREIIGNEDCLFLNVFVPKARNNDKLLPTMVWIHGGMFVFGAGEVYQPDYFMDHDVVLVTLNYRLGSLGFLNTGDTVARGNQGLRDQTMALKWIQANIKQFGGDPKQVTIFGESAGGASVHHHVLSPFSKGLFQKAISQSATAWATWSTRTNPVEQTKMFSKKIGCPTENSKAMVECLRRFDGVKIIEASHADLIDILRDPISVFNPSIEKIKDEHTFIAEHPGDTLRKGNFNKVPWITGVTSEEGLLISAAFLRDSKFKVILDDYDFHMPNVLWHNGAANYTEFEKIKDFYFGTENIDSNDKLQNWTNIFTDKAFGLPAQRSIKFQSKQAPVYAYYYSYKGEFSLTNFLLAFTGKFPPLLEYMLFAIPRWVNRQVFGIQPIHYGACHYDEVALLFPLTDFGGIFIKPTDKDFQMSKIMVKSWVDFATDPTTKPPQFDGITWPRAESKNGQPVKYMHMDIKSGLIDQPNTDRHKFWASLKLKAQS